MDKNRKTLKGYNWKFIGNNSNISNDNVIATILKNRGIEDIDEFINPVFPPNLIKDTEIYKSISHAVQLVKKAIAETKLIIIHGDYDVDGQTSTAILWKAIYHGLNYKNVVPFIPNRFEDGYGLSDKSVLHIKRISSEYGFETNDVVLITVDCGIVSNSQFDELKLMGMTTILTDHHHQGETLPNADCIVWSDKLTGAGIAYLFGNELIGDEKSNALGLILLGAIGTICDLQPLSWVNRSIVHFGLGNEHSDKIKGLLYLKQRCSLKDDFNTYNVGWVIGPCLNASGRLNSAMDGLRLLCSNNNDECKDLAEKLFNLNQQRQDETMIGVDNAIREFENKLLPSVILYVQDDLNEGIIGLIAGRLCEKYSRPTLVLSVDNNTGVAKGSARSLNDINITEILKEKSELFLSVGGHKSAAGCSILYNNIRLLQDYFDSIEIPESELRKYVNVDLNIDGSLISPALIEEIEKLEPFGIGNPKPVFYIEGFNISNIFFMGKDKSHVKLKDYNMNLDALLFNINDNEKALLNKSLDLNVKLVGNASLNVWNNQVSCQMIIQDIEFQ